MQGVPSCSVMAGLISLHLRNLTWHTTITISNRTHNRLTKCLGIRFTFRRFKVVGYINYINISLDHWYRCLIPWNSHIYIYIYVYIYMSVYMYIYMYIYIYMSVYMVYIYVYIYMYIYICIYIYVYMYITLYNYIILISVESVESPEIYFHEFPRASPFHPALPRLATQEFPLRHHWRQLLPWLQAIGQCTVTFNL